MMDQIVEFNSGSRHPDIVFRMGRVLKGHVNAERATIFGKVYSGSFIGPAIQSVQFHEAICLAVRRAMDMWSIIWKASQSSEGCKIDYLKTDLECKMRNTRLQNFKLFSSSPTTFLQT